MFQTLSDDSTRIANSLKASDAPGTNAACKQYLSDLTTFSSSEENPDSIISSNLKSFFGHAMAGAQHCINATEGASTVDEIDIDELNASIEDIKLSNADLDAVNARLNEILAG